MLNKSIFWIFVLFTLVLAGGCTTPVPPEDAVIWKGKFSLESSFKGERKRETGFLKIYISPAKKELLLTTSIGTTIARLDETAEGSSLEAAGRSTIFASTSKQLIGQTIGIPIGLSTITDVLSHPHSTVPQVLDLQITRNFTDNGTRISIYCPETIDRPAVTLLLICREIQ